MAIKKTTDKMNQMTQMQSVARETIQGSFTTQLSHEEQLLVAFK
jgi:hypothetical protein